MASTLAASRPSEKLGTHSTNVFGTSKRINQQGILTSASGPDFGHGTGCPILDAVKGGRARTSCLVSGPDFSRAECHKNESGFSPCLYPPNPRFFSLLLTRSTHARGSRFRNPLHRRMVQP